MKIAGLLFFVLVLVCLPATFGKNVDLSTVPKRDSVQLTIYNSADTCRLSSGSTSVANHGFCCSHCVVRQLGCGSGR